MISVLLVLVSTLLTILIGKAIYKRYNDQQVFVRLGLPFVPPNLLDGNFNDIRNKESNPIEVVSKWVKKYGKVFGYFVGTRATLCLTDLDMIKQVLIKDSNVFSNRPKISIKVEPVMSTLVGLRDQRWKDVRSLLAPTFSMTKMKLMAGIMNKKIDELVKIVQEDCKNGTVTEWYNTYQGLTLEVICECALAMESNCQRDKKDPLIHAVRGFLLNAINPFVVLTLYFPFVGSLMSIVSNKLAYSGRMTQTVVGHLKKIIKMRRSGNYVKTIDVLQLMLDASETAPVDTDAKTTKTKKMSLTDNEIIANAWVFLLGGFETTANALSFTTYLLAKNKAVQEKLYKEISSTIKDKSSHITYEQMSDMPYLDQVLSESLRLYPPVVTFITREAERDIQVGDIKVPKGMTISVPIWDIHRDPELWPKPDEFDPERFSSTTKIESNRHSMAYLPFGAGPRNCIGMRFGQLEAKIALARVVLNFELDICDQTDDPPVLKVPTVAINPANGLHIKATPRD